MDRYTDRVVVITGGGSGIGKATAVRGASEGAKVVVVDMNLDSAVALPMPLPPPVMTTTRSVYLSTMGQPSVEMNTFLTSVNAWSASGPSSRPRPDFLKPPNGVQ